MNEEEVTVVFKVAAGGRERFLAALNKWDEAQGEFGPALGFRADDTVQRRAALQTFADKMELVLRKHDHKTTWRTDPIEMLVRKLKLELMEFDIAYDFERWEEARNEAVDLANFCLIVYDRLSMPDVKK